MICHHCLKETALPLPIGRRDECPHCHVDSHVCKNCEHYDVQLNNECREPKAERVVEKDRANFCDEFGAHKLKAGGVNPLQEAKVTARQAASVLFKK